MSELADRLERELHTATNEELLAIGASPRWQRDRFALTEAIAALRAVEKELQTANTEIAAWQKVWTNENAELRRVVEQMQMVLMLHRKHGSLSDVALHETDVALAAAEKVLK